MQLLYKKDLGFLEDQKIKRSKCQTALKREKKKKKEKKHKITFETQTEFLLCNSKLTKSLRKHSSALSITVQGMHGSERAEKNNNKSSRKCDL